MNDQFLEVALRLRRQGISSFPASGKRPGIPTWAQFTAHIPAESQIRAWAQAGRYQNIAVVCGAVSQLVVIDLDGDNAVSTFWARWSFDTLVISSGGGHGEHVYLRPAVMPPTVRAMGIAGGGNIEVRAEGTYVIGPPSVHPETGAAYTVKHRRPILQVDDLEDLLAWVRGLTARSHVGERRESGGGLPGANNQRAIGFAMTALESEADAVRRTPKGGQNDRLNLAAYSLGQLVGDGLLARDVVERELLAAALAAGQPERPSARTIQSGLVAGMNNPRSLRYGGR